MKGKPRIILAFCLSILILLIIGAFAYQSAHKQGHESGWVDHTHQVISDMQDVLVEVQKIETAQRGYMITGSDKYLEPYTDGINAIPPAFVRLRERTSDNRQQQALLDSIHTLVVSKISFAQQVVEGQKKDGFKAAQGLVSTNVGENIMQKIRQEVNEFIKNEKHLLDIRLAAAEESLSATLRVIILSIGLAIIIVLITLYFFLKEHSLLLRSEKKLLESEYRVKSFLEALPLGVFVVDAKGNAYYANSKSQEILGKGLMLKATLGEIQQLYKVYISGTSHLYPLEKLPVSRVLKGERHVCIEDMEVEKDGRRIPLRINATNITDSEGNIEYGISVFEDISDIKETEKKLIEARKLAEESSRLKEAFLANMSHEIRTPMNAIIGFTDLLIKRNIAAQENDYVRTIKTSAENLLRIINDVLDVSKMESGLMTFEFFPISIRQVFSSLQSMLLVKATEKKLHLRFSCDSHLPDPLLGDPTRLTQIILNLAGNALKFTQEGSVEVFARLVSYANDVYQIEFTVKDTGIGIPPDKLERIFERFTQAEEHTTRHYGGTGLGLNIAKQLVELQGGTITVTSRVNVGSEFKFILPFKKAPEPRMGKDDARSTIHPSELKTKKILVVEDNPVNIKFITTLFSEYSIPCDLAENGKIAVEKVKQTNYDVVLMDIEMPEMNGYEATLVIRDDLQSKVPIIAMTAHAMAGEKEKCLQLGMNAYISKPIREDLLFEKMFSLCLPSNKPDLVQNNTIGKEIDLNFLVKAMKGKRSAILEMINVFTAQAPADLFELSEAIESADFAAIRRISHRMKSSASLVGASKTESLLEKIEKQAASQTELPKIKTMMRPINELYDAVLKELIAEKQNYI